MAKSRYSDVTVSLLGPCSTIYKSFASHRLLPAFLLHAHISVCLHTASCDRSLIWRPEPQTLVSSTLCSAPLLDPQCSTEMMLKSPELPPSPRDAAERLPTHDVFIVHSSALCSAPSAT